MGLIDSFAEDVTLRRYDPDQYVKGRLVKSGTYTDSTISASVQPASPREVEQLPEGRRSKETLKVYSETELREPDQANNIRGDVLIYAGREFEVMKLFPWHLQTIQSMRHYKALAVRIGEDE